ncbi:5-deoxy-glucuronate isomerase [Planctomonas psychrotolerans]|uniref:5-deoxy-glucuronate isomerase n=1 Tax=Planctomonas psychrotolerans TaxID=2528712 RepID=UPI00123B7ECF|nr:5-deoxy-glucuronate isomerase [Planctomonas psychrotolerans]
MQHSGTWFHPRGALARDGWESVVDDALPGWAHTGLRVGELGGAAIELPAGDVERVVVPLTGSIDVDWVAPGTPGSSVSVTTTRLHGRVSVFDGPTDVLYLGAGTSATLKRSADGAARVAVAEAVTATRHPDRYIARNEVPVELRGAGRSSRQVHNFGTPDTLDAATILVCEVLTPAGNWSSYPAHKHDEHVPGRESRLEEIYYFESDTARGSTAPGDADPFGMFSTYSSPAGVIDIDARVRTGDIALVPYGYHGPAAAAPDYDLYYLNVMAGPDPERTWLIQDDPAHAWVRAGWEHQAMDPRLPYTATPKER